MPHRISNSPKICRRIISNNKTRRKKIAAASRPWLRDRAAIWKRTRARAGGAAVRSKGPFGTAPPQLRLQLPGGALPNVSTETALNREQEPKLTKEPEPLICGSLPAPTRELQTTESTAVISGNQMMSKAYTRSYFLPNDS